MQPGGRRQTLGSRLAAGVSEPTSGCAVGAQIHGTVLKAAVPPPSHSAMFPSPVRGREVNPGPAASPQLRSGEHPRRAGLPEGLCCSFQAGCFLQQLTMLLSWDSSFSWLFLIAFKLWILNICCAWFISDLVLGGLQRLGHNTNSD